MRQRSFEKRELILMNLIWNIDSKQSEINKAVVKIMFTVKMKCSDSLYNDARGVFQTLPKT